MIGLCLKLFSKHGIKIFSFIKHLMLMATLLRITKRGEFCYGPHPV